MALQYPEIVKLDKLDKLGMVHSWVYHTNSKGHFLREGVCEGSSPKNLRCKWQSTWFSFEQNQGFTNRNWQGIGLPTLSPESCSISDSFMCMNSHPPTCGTQDPEWSLVQPNCSHKFNQKKSMLEMHSWKKKRCIYLGWCSLILSYLVQAWNSHEMWYSHYYSHIPTSIPMKFPLIFPSFPHLLG